MKDEPGSRSQTPHVNVGEDVQQMSLSACRKTESAQIELEF